MAVGMSNTAGIAQALLRAREQQAAIRGHALSAAETQGLISGAVMEDLQNKEQQARIADERNRFAQQLQLQKDQLAQQQAQYESSLAQQQTQYESSLALQQQNAQQSYSLQQQQMENQQAQGMGEFGSMIGGGLGTLIGGPVGGFIGTALGGIAGGLFGGSK